ncbi:MAG: BatA domain-containing protein [Planctomycetota bacterium]
MLDFVNPLFAWLALAAAIPLVIHLLNRRRYQQVRWAAMDFLLKALHKNRRRLQMESLILLLLRMLIVTVLAFILAKPYLKGSVLFREPDTHLVIAIDNSYSMGYRPGMSAIFEEAKKAATGLMGQLKPEKGDKLSLITISSRPEILISESSFQMEQARSKLANLALSDYATDISKTFALAQEILNKSTSSRKIMCLITDNQRTAWDKINAIKDKNIMGLIPVKVIQVGPANPGNNLINRIYADKALVTAREPVTFYAEIRNYSGVTQEPVAVNVNFFVQGQKYGSSSAELPTNGSAVVPFINTFNEPGQYWIKMELSASGETSPNAFGGQDSDNLMLDDSRLYSVTVKEGINTLIINGEPARPDGAGRSLNAVPSGSGGPSAEPSAKSQRSPDDFGEDEILFLRYALSPSQSSGDAFSPYRINTATITEFINNDVKLEEYDLVIMANVEFLPPEKAGQMEGFVRNGGGLLVFLGDKVNRLSYNELLYKNGEGLMPYALGEVRGDQTHSEAIRFGEVDFTHPALTFFSSIKERFNTLVIHQYYGFAEEGATATALARLNPVRSEHGKVNNITDGSKTLTSDASNGVNQPDKPAIIAEKPFGKGRTMVIATSADNEWNLMPARPMYVMLVDRLALYLASFRDKALNRNLIVGEPIEMPARLNDISRSDGSAESSRTVHWGEDAPAPVERGGAQSSHTLRLPKKESISLSLTGSTLRYDTKEAGLYTLSGGKEERFFAVNPDPAEGDLRKITEGELQALVPSLEIFPADGLDFTGNVAIGLPLKDSNDLSTTTLWKYLLYILLVSVGLEMLLAWRFGRR